MNTIALLKIVFTGSLGSGKTTAIHTISAIGSAESEEKFRTASMDYGQFYISKHEKIDLYGTVGSKRFGFMSATLCQGSLGLIILINSTHKDPLDEVDYYLNLNKDFLKTNPAIIAITHYDKKNALPIAHYRAYIHRRGENWPIICIDARQYDDVVILLKSLLLSREYT